MMFRTPFGGAGGIVAFLALALSIATSASANHPGEDLNEVMAAKEAAFEPVSPQQAPELAWHGGPGASVRLDSLQGKIAVVSFVPPDCGPPCSDQQDQLGRAIESLNASPMREMVTFVTVGEAPDGEPDAAANWTRAQPGAGPTIADRAAAFASVSDRTDGLPMIHLIDRSGRQVGIFHGADFLPLNLVLYINGLTNAHPHSKPGLLNRLFGLLP